MDQITPDEFHALAARVDKLEQHMKTNMVKIDHIDRNTKSLVETFEALGGGFKVLQGIGRLAKPISYITAALVGMVAVWNAFKGFIR